MVYYLKYIDPIIIFNRSPAFIRLSTMLAPVVSSLDEIYCSNVKTVDE